jgi:two-component system alkaline phosphatase synthesis response regulator PhoP
VVLVADDMPDLRLLVRSALRHEGIRVLEACNGDEALAIARRERPDLILLDVAMPALDGFSVCRALRGDPNTSGLKVLMLTARAQKADRARGAEVGADGYLTKPFRHQALLEAVRQLLA